MQGVLVELWREYEKSGVSTLAYKRDGGWHASDLRFALACQIHCQVEVTGILYDEYVPIARIAVPCKLGIRPLQPVMLVGHRIPVPRFLEVGTHVLIIYGGLSATR